MSVFRLVSAAIDNAALRAELEDAGSGACVVFEGWVRNHNEGRSVERLEYEAYEPIAAKEAKRIVAEAKQRFAIKRALCVHREGLLEIGECSVWVGVSSPHRAAAFDAARYIIDEVKHRLPIWKREHYSDGDLAWVECQHCASDGH